MYELTRIINGESKTYQLDDFEEAVTETQEHFDIAIAEAVQSNKNVNASCVVKRSIANGAAILFESSIKVHVEKLSTNEKEELSTI